jgi:broad specificity phosphatase PhoE
MRAAILARHGESEFSAGGVVSGDPSDPRGLTERGRAQARALGRALADVDLDLCVTSAFPRVRETADLALDGRHVPRLVVPELNDFRCGEFEGKPFAEYRVWAEAASPEERVPGGESRAEVAARYARAFRLLLARPEVTLLVVAHGLPIRYALLAREGRDARPIVDQVPLAEPFPFTAPELDRVASGLERWAAAPAWSRARATRDNTSDTAP